MSEELRSQLDLRGTGFVGYFPHPSTPVLSGAIAELDHTHFLGDR
ncbi:hypothetical protein [Oscillatoria acuminata]|nr:hypothetical protein [Oscillatoria acuminata]